MFETTRGMLVPDLANACCPSLFALIAAVPIAARGDDGMVDVRTLPRLEGAVEEVARTKSYRLNYSVPTVVRSRPPRRASCWPAPAGWNTSPVEPIQPPDVVQEGTTWLVRVVLRRPRAGRINRSCITAPTGSTPMCRSERRYRHRVQFPAPLS